MRCEVISPRSMLPDRVYHLVEASNWPSVQSHGLLSACELFRLTEVPMEARVRISTTRAFS